MENCVDVPSSLGLVMPGVNDCFAVGPLAFVLPQLPQVNQVRVSSTLSRTVVPAGGGDPGDGAVPGAELDEAFGVGALVFEAGLPPQEVMVTAKTRVRSEVAKNRIRNTSAPGEKLVWQEQLGHCSRQRNGLHSAKGPILLGKG